MCPSHSMYACQFARVTSSKSLYASCSAQVALRSSHVTLLTSLCTGHFMQATVCKLYSESEQVAVREALYARRSTQYL